MMTKKQFEFLREFDKLCRKYNLELYSTKGEIEITKGIFEGDVALFWDDMGKGKSNISDIHYQTRRMYKYINTPSSYFRTFEDYETK